MAFAIISKKGLTAALLTVMLAGCTCSNELTTPREVEPTTRATLRIAHASPDAPSLTCLQNDKFFADQIRYDASVMSAASLPSELRNLRFTDGTATAVLSLNVNLVADRQHTLVVLDHVDRLRGLLLQDVKPTPTQGHAQVRVVHADPAFKSLTVSDENGDEDVPFGEASRWRIVPAGGSLVITRGADEPLTVDPTVLTDGATLTLIVRADDGPGDQLVMLNVP